MAVDQDNVSKLLLALSHHLRREILLNLDEKKECSFTELMNALKIDTGKLSFHIRSLEGLIEQTPTGQYQLTPAGENALLIVRDLERFVVEVDAERKNSIFPLANVRRRSAAFVIDLAICLGVFVVTYVMTNLFSLFTSGSTSQLETNVLLFFILLWVYFTLLEGFAGQSLGKRVVGLRVIKMDGERIYYDHAAIRSLGKAFLFLLPIDLLIGARLDDRRFIRYFDKFAGTTVIDLHP